METWKAIVLGLLCLSFFLVVGFLFIIFINERNFNKKLDNWDEKVKISCKFFDGEDSKVGFIKSKVKDQLFTYIVVDEFGEENEVLRGNIYSRLL